MDVKHIDTIEFEGPPYDGQGLIIGCQVGNQVGICLSLEKGSDVEVFIDKVVAERLMAALKTAAEKN